MGHLNWLITVTLSVDAPQNPLRATFGDFTPFIRNRLWSLQRRGMPNYDYICQGCGESLTRNVPLAERDKVFCMKCQKPMLRQLSAPGIAFKGTGWTPKFHQ